MYDYYCPRCGSRHHNSDVEWLPPSDYGFVCWASPLCRACRGMLKHGAMPVLRCTLAISVFVLFLSGFVLGGGMEIAVLAGTIMALGSLFAFLRYVGAIAIRKRRSTMHHE